MHTAPLEVLYRIIYLFYFIFIEEEEEVDVEAEEEDVGLEALVHSAETAGQTKTEVLNSHGACNIIGFYHVLYGSCIDWVRDKSNNFGFVLSEDSDINYT